MHYEKTYWVLKFCFMSSERTPLNKFLGVSLVFSSSDFLLNL